MSPAGIGKQELVAGHQRQAEFAGRRYQHAVRWIAMQVAGQARGLDQDSRRQGKHLETTLFRPLLYEPLTDIPRSSL